MRSARVAALFLQPHSLASCPFLRFSSAKQNIPIRDHRIKQKLLPVPPLHQTPAIARPRAAAPANGAEEEEEVETEAVHHRLLRTQIREECIQ